MLRTCTAGAMRADRFAVLLGLLALALPPGPRAAEPTGDAGAEFALAELGAPDLTGDWLLRHRIDSSAVDEYEGLELQFRLQLVQRGERLVGTATQWRENGRAVAAGARSRLELEGTMEGREIVGRYVERIGERRSTGTFRWRYSLQDGTLRGTFRSSVAESAGLSLAVATG